MLESLKREYENYPVNLDILGNIIYKRTYARYIEELGRKEEYYETIYRCLRSLVEDVGVPFTYNELSRLYRYHMELKCSLAGRQLWQLGTKLVKQGYADSLYNCYFFAIDDVESFCSIFEELMLGGGCGFSVQRRYISKLPVVKKSYIMVNNELPVKENLSYAEREYGYFEDGTLFVGDSREGWVFLLRAILDSFFYTGRSFEINTRMVRRKGELLKGFGGLSSGDEYLIKGMNEIINLLYSRAGRSISSVDALDIVCILASIVISGNVRRSATIGLGDLDDVEFLKCKRWDLGNVPYWRSYVNISVSSSEFPVVDLFWDSYRKDTEAIGLFNLRNARRYGRLGVNKDSDRHYYTDLYGIRALQSSFNLDRDVEGVNPCGEITLADGESCLLGEVVLPNVSSYSEFIDICKLLYKANKHITQMKFLSKKTQSVNNKNARIGISITGILDCYDKFLSYASRGYNDLRLYDLEYSKKNDLPISIKLTTIQPHGTKSLMFNVSQGLHPQYAKYYYRTIRLSKNDELVNYCHRMGLRIENQQFYEGKDKIVEDENTKVIYFPRKSRDGSILSDGLTAIEHLKMVMKAQEIWSDNSISVTVYYDKSELDDIRSFLASNWSNFKTVSLLPKTHGFIQAPIIPISEEEYKRYVTNIKEIDINIRGGDIIDDIGCDKGSCGIR